MTQQTQQTPSKWILRMWRATGELCFAEYFEDARRLQAQVAELIAHGTKFQVEVWPR